MALDSEDRRTNDDRIMDALVRMHEKLDANILEQTKLNLEISKTLVRHEEKIKVAEESVKDMKTYALKAATIIGGGLATASHGVKSWLTAIFTSGGNH